MGGFQYIKKSKLRGGLLGKIDAPLNKMLQNVEWGEYRLGDLFDVDSWVYGKNKKYFTELKYSTSKSISVVSGITENNGINYYTEDKLSEDEIFESELTITTRGEYSGTVFYHPEKFVLANNILVMIIPNWSKNHKIFIGSIINSLSYGGYSGYPRKETLANDLILLPTRKGEIDFEFMDKFISELEAQRISELEAYLLVTNLKDYSLTEEEKHALKEFENIVWENYYYKDIFNHIVQGRRLTKEDQLPGNIPFVMSGTTNTGVVNYISNPVASFPGNSITVDIFGNAFYRNYYFGAGDDTGVYWNDRIVYSKETMLFFTTSMSKSLLGKYSYGKKLRSSQSLNFKMQLPSCNKQPNYSIMETIISAIQKLVIKDVVEYVDRKIETTKEVCK